MNARRQRFVNAYLGDAAGNATQAAIAAGYSPKTARQAGSRLLTFADVRQAVDTAQQALVEQAGYTAERVIQELAFVADARPADIRAGDKVKALELLGKAHGLFQDKQKADSRITVNIGFLSPQPPTLDVSLAPARRVSTRLPQALSVTVEDDA